MIKHMHVGIMHQHFPISYAIALFFMLLNMVAKSNLYGLIAMDIAEGDCHLLTGSFFKYTVSAPHPTILSLTHLYGYHFSYTHPVSHTRTHTHFYINNNFAPIWGVPVVLLMLLGFTNAQCLCCTINVTCT